MNNTTPRKILCLCSANRCRSKTLEAMLKETPGFEARSAGTHPVAHGRALMQEDLDWADQIILFEHVHLKELANRFPAIINTKPIVNLDIPDEFPPYVQELIAILKERFALWFETPLADPIRPANWWTL